MGRIPENYMERVYAGWLGKLIGVRHGAPIEGWTYEKIQQQCGEITSYLVDYKDFAADDDSNGPMFFLKSLEDYTYTTDLSAKEIGLTWLNYAPYEHGFYWWGGYGVSTEHTAYLNLRNGIMAPRSGSIEQNGLTVAEQIGGQIFIDTWGLVVPNDPKLAADYASKAASVSHGGNGIYGGMFIAACISAAFTEKDIIKIIEAGLSVVPKGSEYTRVVRAVMKYHDEHPDNWRDCFIYLKENFGYDRYLGACHIIPNSGVIILSLLYGNGDFSRTINICNMCGWDTDCNVANVGTIMGVRGGLDCIDYRWRKPINDFLACSSVVGSLNIMDIPSCASYIAKYAYLIASEEPQSQWKDIIEGNAARFHFEFPGSTHGFRIDCEKDSEYEISNTNEVSHTGSSSLKIYPKAAGRGLKVFYKTHYRPKDFHDSRYDPSFSPLLYPGQQVSASVMVPTGRVSAFIYVRDGNSGNIIEGNKAELIPGKWSELYFDIPHMDGACIDETGISITSLDGGLVGEVYLDDFDFGGEPDYTINFSRERIEVWTGTHREVSQFTRLKGIWTLENGELSGSCCDFGESYTGAHDWKDYTFEATIIPKLGEYHNINFRVQGAIRSYAAGLAPGNRLVLLKNNNGYSALSEVDFPWECEKEYTFKVEVKGVSIKVWHGGRLLIRYEDIDNPYLTGQIGASVLKGSHCHYKDFKIARVK